jgi:hypothetical protein
MPPGPHVSLLFWWRFRIDIKGRLPTRWHHAGDKPAPEDLNRFKEKNARIP